MIGRHTIKHWSSTQASVTLSSGEAEFHGCVKACGMGLGYQSLLRDLGLDAPLRVWTDSSAAIGICSRQGLGKLRHVDTHLLWVQQAVRQRRLELRKVAGTANPADVFTKYPASRDKLIFLTGMFDCHFAGGRAESAPKLRRTSGTKGVLAGEMEGPEDGGEALPEANSVEKAVMPHLQHDQATMDRMYPAFEPDPEHDDGEHMEPEERDRLLEYGLRIAEDIRRDNLVHGRTARVIPKEQLLLSIVERLRDEEDGVF